MKVSIYSLVFWTAFMWGLAEIQYSLTSMYLWQPEAFKSNIVNGTIISKRIAPTTGRYGNELIKLTYLYEIDGAIYRSSVCNLKSPVIPKRYAAKFLENHSYRVAYDPKDPYKAILKDCNVGGFEINGIRILVLSFLFALIVSLRFTRKLSFWG